MCFIKFENFQVLLSTYAKDGGLYVPEYLPIISFEQLLSWKDCAFSEICAEIIFLFTENIPIEELRAMTTVAFSGFNQGGSCPIPMTTYGDIITLDTSLGPTLAFKDIGQQVTDCDYSFVILTC